MTRRRRILLIAAAALVALMVIPGVSYGRALGAPGSAPWSQRTVDWIRSNHGNGLMNAIENWYYTRHQPGTGPPEPATLPQAAAGRRGTPRARGPRRRRRRCRCRPARPGWPERTPGWRAGPPGMAGH
jgi:hypothetical protein